MSILETSFVAASSSVKKTDSSRLSSVEEESESPEMSFDRQLQGEIEKNTDDSVITEAQDQSLITEHQAQQPLLESLDVELLDEPVAEMNILTSGNILPIQSPVNAFPQNVSVDTDELIADQTTAKVVSMNPQLATSRSLISPAQTTDNSLEPDTSDQNLLDMDNPDLPDEVLSNSAKNQSNQRELAITTKQETTEFVKVIRSVNPPVVNLAVASDTTAKSLIDDGVTQQFQLNTPVNQKQWGNELTQRMSMMVSNGQQQVAELRLNPVHLGPLNVRIQIEDDQANISFVTNNQLVKEAVEVALPRLREQLQEQGLDLGHVDVSTKDNEDSEADSAAGNTQDGSGNESFDRGSDMQEIETSVDISDGVSVFV